VTATKREYFKLRSKEANPLLLAVDEVHVDMSEVVLREIPSCSTTLSGGASRVDRAVAGAAPHRSGRADFPHRALQVTDSLVAD
jgi:hypothetical protein